MTIHTDIMASQRAVHREADSSSPASNGYLDCECSSWCRANPQPITDKHHMYCPKYNDTIKVVKITLEGHGSYCDADIAGALQALADGGDYCYQVEIMDMMKREYEALPEHTGF